jgi:uncharacterized protein
VVAAYVDSSAYVKLLVEEAGSDVAATIWDGCDVAICSRIGHPEVRAALATAGRDRRLDVDDLRRAETAREGYWGATRPVELTASVMAQAGDLAGRYALRGADAVHLASALTIGVDQVVVVAWDRRLRDAVDAVGIRLGPRALR